MTHNSDHQALIVVDLGYGDAGKGTLVEHLVHSHDAHTVVRFNGGAQAGHNIVTPDGRHHTFSQFGAATFLPGVQTHLSRFMVAHPLAMLAEEAHLSALGTHDAFARTTCADAALVITPFHQAMCRLRELARGRGHHGSVGVGVGETVSDSLDHPERAITMGDLRDRRLLRRKLTDIRALKRAQLRAIEPALRDLPLTARETAQDELAILTGATDPIIDLCLEGFAEVASRLRITDPSYTEALLRRPGTTVFEAAQGVLLDEWHGFHPHTTWSTTTFANATTLLTEAEYSGETVRIGVTRTHATRHGAGPFVTEDDTLGALLPDPHNNPHPWQGSFRVGWLDLVATRYALEVCGGADVLAVTHLDRFADLDRWPVAVAYNHLGDASTDGLFDTDPNTGQLTRIVPAYDHDLDHQASITRCLFDCDPVYRALLPSTQTGAAPLERLRGYLSHLEDVLKTPIQWASVGPTRNDKLTLR